LAVWPMLWNGSSWSLNDGTVVGNTSQVRNLSGVAFATTSAFVTGAAGTFVPADVGKTLDSANAYPGTRIVAVSPDGSSATISPRNAKTTGTADAAIGHAVVSEATIASTSGATGPYPGTQYLSNVLDDTGPSYAISLSLVGFADDPNGVQSALCAGARSSDIL